MSDVGSEGDVKVISAMERVDALTAGDLEKIFNEAVAGGATKLLCDLQMSKYISSAGLRVFLIILKTMKRSGGEIVLCCLQPPVKEVFDMAGLGRLFRIFNSREEAFRAINNTA